MNGKRIVGLAFVLALGFIPLAVEGGDYGNGNDYGSGHGTTSQGAGHGGHGAAGHAAMEDGMVMLGEQTVDGVKAVATIKDVRDVMAKAGMKETHHLQILFTDAKGKTVTSGTVAVKMTSPAGGDVGPLALAGMDGHFGVDLTLAAPGAYRLAVGTKLADGVKRQFEFTYSRKE